MASTLSGPSRTNRGRRLLWSLILGLGVSLLYYWWKLAPPPSVGGGKPESWFATRLKNRVYAEISPQEEQGFVRLTDANAPGWYSKEREVIQSFDYYQSQNPLRPTPSRRTLVLQPIGDFPKQGQQLMEPLRDYCSRFFQLPVRIAEPIPLPVNPPKLRPKRNKAPDWCAGKGQYSATELIFSTLVPKVPSDACLYLGVTMADLYVDNMNFVFGLGSLKQRVGVYSLTRYFPEFSGHKSTPADQVKALERSCKVLNHETGHMFGIYHCVLYRCSMNGANSLADADSTPREFCPVCRKKLFWNVGADAGKRDRELKEFYRRVGLG